MAFASVQDRPRGGAGWSRPRRAFEPWEEKWGAIIAGVALLWIGLVVTWGCDGIFPDGHFAANAAAGLGAYNMWRYHIIYPVLYNHGLIAPAKSAYYLHHPLGNFWVSAILQKIFGNANVVVRLPAILETLGSTYFLYRLGRAIWTPLAGGFCALAYASLPITVGFGNFHALENATIFGCVLGTFGYARFVQTWQRRYAFALMAGVGYAINHDWITYLWLGMLGSWMFLRAFVLPPSWFGPTDLRAAARVWGGTVALALLSLGLVFYLEVDSGKLSDLLSAYTWRSAGNSMPLKAVLEGRRVWIELMFSGVAIALGKLALLAILARLAIKRSEFELLPLFFLVVALIQYLHFKQGADIHIFWPQYFAPYYALGIGALVASVDDLCARYGARIRGQVGVVASRYPQIVAAVMIGVPVLFVWQDGARLARLARETGGRFISTGIQSDVEKIQAIQWQLPRFGPEDNIGFHSGVQPLHWALMWELRPHNLVPNQPIGTKATQHDPLYVMDARFASESDLKTALANYHVRVLDNFWLIDRRDPVAPLDGFRFVEKEPNLFQSFWYGATEPLRKVAADPWVTWQWRTAFGQAATTPTGEPETLPQVAVAHNVALTVGDQARAQQLRARLEKSLRQPTGVRFDNGTVLLGLYQHKGAERSITLYFLAGDFKGGRANFTVQAKVVKAPRFSSLPQDPVEITVSFPQGMTTALWKPGHIYSLKVVYRKRPGTELLTGTFTPADGHPVPKVVGGPQQIELIRL